MFFCKTAYNEKIVPINKHTIVKIKENEIPIILHCAKSPIPVLTSNPSTDTGRNSIAHPKSITTTSNLSPIRFFLLLFSCLFFTYYLQGYILYNYISLVL